MIELAPILKDHLSYDEAWLYCATLTYNNKYDWRIPTEDEFIYNEEISDQSFDQTDDLRYRGWSAFKWRINPVRTIDN